MLPEPAAETPPRSGSGPDPGPLVLPGRLFDFHVLDMIEVGIEKYVSLSDIKVTTEMKAGDDPGSSVRFTAAPLVALSGSRSVLPRLL